MVYEKINDLVEIINHLTKFLIWFMMRIFRPQKNFRLKIFFRPKTNFRPPKNFRPKIFFGCGLFIFSVPIIFIRMVQRVHYTDVVGFPDGSRLVTTTTMSIFGTYTMVLRLVDRQRFTRWNQQDSNLGRYVVTPAL